MRRDVWVAVLVTAILAGCGHRSATVARHDATVVDAPVSPVDAAVVPTWCLVKPGTNISQHLIGKVGDVVTLATSPPGDGRLFVVERGGLIQLFDVDYHLVTTPFLDLSANDQGPIISGGELGLLGLAFAPDYATSHQFYVYYTADNPAGSAAFPFLDIVARYTTMPDDPDVADPTSAEIVMAVPDYADNHNGGMMEFGSDGYLYIATGDGGSEGDPLREGQNAESLLGKMLRIDVSHPAAGSAYAIPVDNPFADGSGGAPEVYMVGLRNPWRWSFDAATGAMWIADVGQDQFEEVDYIPAGQQRGANLGWSIYEGSACCATETGSCHQSKPFQTCNPAGLVFPQIIRSHTGDGWRAVIGGQVYRGTCYPDIVGIYFFTDNTLGGLSEATVGSDGTVTSVDLPGHWPASPAAIHAGPYGELFETTTTGEIFHIAAGNDNVPPLP